LRTYCLEIAPTVRLSLCNTLVYLFLAGLPLVFGIICAYAMLFIVLSLTKLPGVPARVSQGHWRDPHDLIKSDSQYLVHNHILVVKVISWDEYQAYSMLVLGYFPSAWMVLSAIALLRLNQRYRQNPAKKGGINPPRLPALILSAC
jgi:hypothetical protein